MPAHSEAESPADAPATLADVRGFDDYLLRYGELMAGQTVRSLAPLHVPDRDPPWSGTGLLRTPFPAQAHVIAAGRAALRRQRSVQVAAECGTGKSLMGQLIAHAHADGRPYRGLVMAPDHLVKKWREEIETTIPGAAVTVFGGWRDVLALSGRFRGGYCKLSNRQHRAAWTGPDGPEWYILGRDQSKGDPAREPAVVERRKGVLRRADPDGGVGGPARVLHPYTSYHCPRCGQRLLDRADVPIPLDRFAPRTLRCRNLVRRPDRDGTLVPCDGVLWQYCHRPTKAKLAAIRKARHRWHDDLPGHRESLGERTGNRPKTCPYRWAPDLIIQRRLKGFFDYLIIDEIHEEKSSDSGQGNAAGKLAASCRKAIGLTGTLLGGYAWHVFPTLYRLAPTDVAELGFAWGKEMPFSQRYGRVEETITTTTKDDPKRNSHTRGGTRTERRSKCVPGIMPTLFGDLLMANTIFLGLEEVSDALPPRPVDEVIPVPMDTDQQSAYLNLERRIAAFLAPLIRRGDMSLLSRMLQGLLAWPDHPFGWGTYFDVFDVPRAPELEEGRIYPKERALIDRCLRERDEGRQVWVGCQMTGVRDVEGRLERLLRDAGLKVGVLRSSVDRRERMRWITTKGRTLDVALSHPRLVETGLDLFDKRPGGANFSTILSYQTGYNLFTLRQFSRRSWRIGQTKECRIGYLYYTTGDPERPVMQERAVGLMGKKLAASQAIDGKFSAEGLAAMAGEDSAEMALARALCDRVPEAAAARVWSRVGAVTHPPLARSVAGLGASQFIIDDPHEPPQISPSGRGTQLSLFDQDPGA